MANNYKVKLKDIQNKYKFKIFCAGYKYDDTELRGLIDDRALITEAGTYIELALDPATYLLTAILKDKNNNVISTSTPIDLNIESMIINAEYDDNTKSLIIYLQNGTEIAIPLGDLVSGLQAEITPTNKLSSDLVDDTNHTNKFVTEANKTSWNGKYEKPSSGIPKTDLSNSVQTSLNKADTSIQSHQDISGKEDKSNKVTSFSSSSTNAQYPSAKAVYDSQKLQDDTIEELESNLEATQQELDKYKTICNALPKVTGEGETVILDDTVNSFLDITLKGNTSQDGTPTPNTPIPVNVVSGDNEIVVCGKNLLKNYIHDDDTTYTTNGITFTKNSDGSITANGTATGIAKWEFASESSTLRKPIKAGSYILSGGINSNAFIRIGITDVTEKYATSSSVSFTVSADNTYYANITISSGTTVNNVVFQPMLRLASATDDTYEPYTEATYLINLPEGMELCKIGDYQDYFLHDKTLDKWYKHSEIKKYTMTGKESLGYTSTRTNTFRFASVFSDKRPNSTNLDIYMYCNRGRGVPDAYWNTDEPGVCEIKNATQKLIIFSLPISEVSDIPTAEIWFENHETILYYQLATPTDTEITYQPLIEQLNILEKAESCKGQTNISSTYESGNAPFIISASALYDLNKLVTRVAVLETE